MRTLVTILLLVADSHHWTDWVGIAIMVWLPQLIWAGLAVLLLVGVMLALRRLWIRWLLMWVPYAMIGWAIYHGLRIGGGWNYTYPPHFSISAIVHDSLLRERMAPTFLAVPFMILLHIWLFWREARRKAREA